MAFYLALRHKHNSLSLALSISFTDSTYFSNAPILTYQVLSYSLCLPPRLCSHVGNFSIEIFGDIFRQDCSKIFLIISVNRNVQV